MVGSGLGRLRRRLGEEMRAFAAAAGLLTRIPIAPKTPPSPEDLRRSLRWYGAVGVLLGFLLWAVSLVLRELRVPAPGAAALLVAVDVWWTGGLHFDGWMDAADGLGSHRNRERILEIMRDSRVGAMGVLAAVCALLVEWAFLQTWWIRGAAPDVLLAAWGWSRWVMAWAVVVYPYAREEGMGAALRGARRSDAVWSAVPLLIPAVMAIGNGRLSVLVASAAAWAAAWRAAGRIAGRLGGLTGDVYGALCVLTQVVCLASAEVAESWMERIGGS